MDYWECGLVEWMVNDGDRRTGKIWIRVGPPPA